jgi:hypothetical protein
MRPRPAQVAEQPGVGEAGLFEQVGEDGQVLEAPLLVDGCGQPASGTAVVGQDSGVNRGGRLERVGEVAEQDALHGLDRKSDGPGVVPPLLSRHGGQAALHGGALRRPGQVARRHRRHRCRRPPGLVGGHHVRGQLSRPRRPSARHLQDPVHRPLLRGLGRPPGGL